MIVARNNQRGTQAENEQGAGKYTRLPLLIIICLINRRRLRGVTRSLPVYYLDQVWFLSSEAFFQFIHWVGKEMFINPGKHPALLRGRLPVAFPKGYRFSDHPLPFPVDRADCHIRRGIIVYRHSAPPVALLWKYYKNSCGYCH